MAGELAVGVIGFTRERALGFGDLARGRFGRWFGCFGELLAQEADVFEQRGLSLAVRNRVIADLRLCVGDDGAKAQMVGAWIGLLLAVSAWGLWGHFVERRHHSWGGSLSRDLAVGVVGVWRRR